MTFFERLHDQSLIPRCSFRCSSIICVFFLYLIWLEDQNEAFGLRIHPSVIFLECFQKYGMRYGMIRYMVNFIIYSIIAFSSVLSFNSYRHIMITLIYAAMNFWMFQLVLTAIVLMNNCTNGLYTKYIYSQICYPTMLFVFKLYNLPSTISWITYRRRCFFWRFVRFVKDNRHLLRPRLCHF